LLAAGLCMQVPKTKSKSKDATPDRTALATPSVATEFVEAFGAEMRDIIAKDGTCEDPNTWQERFSRAFMHAQGSLPRTNATPRRPWISAGTLDLIDARNRAQTAGDWALMWRLKAEVRKSVKKDRRRWLDELVESGEWSKVRQLRKGFKPQPSKLKNSTGEVVDSIDRAETLADYYEKVQWRVRPDDLLEHGDSLGPELDVDLGPISHEELAVAAKSLRRNRASGVDLVPAEFWKAILEANSEAGVWATEFINACWDLQQTPVQWHMARVAAIFKKGAHDDPANYRPISLLCVVYKLFTSVLLQRLKRAGAEERIWPTQYGFRSGSGTRDALFLARRMLEATWQVADGKLMFLALDWAKAFDSVSPAALCNALRRFGLPSKVIRMVEAIYDDRTFFVREGGADSSPHRQAFGISQGCPLSPFLFVMMMTVLMHDASRRVEARFGEPSEPLVATRTLLYADDTLIIDAKADVAQHYMEVIAEEGARYGMSYNWAKLEVLRVRHGGHITKEDGSHVKEKDAIVYLGSLLAADGQVDTELSRRLGMATAEFAALERLWMHASIPKTRKIAIYRACILQKLLYCLETTWLTAAASRKLDGFHAKCLRKICKIQHSYLSRVSNADVLKDAGEQPLTATLRYRQLKLFGRIALMQEDTLMRKVTFEPGSFDVRRRIGARRRGRPRQTWTPCVRAHAVAAAGGEDELTRMMENTAGGRAAWSKAIWSYCYKGKDCSSRCDANGGE